MINVLRAAILRHRDQHGQCVFYDIYDQHAQGLFCFKTLENTADCVNDTGHQ